MLFDNLNFKHYFLQLINVQLILIIFPSSQNYYTNRRIVRKTVEKKMRWCVCVRSMKKSIEWRMHGISHFNDMHIAHLYYVLNFYLTKAKKKCMQTTFTHTNVRNLCGIFTLFCISICTITFCIAYKLYVFSATFPFLSNTFDDSHCILYLKFFFRC